MLIKNFGMVSAGVRGFRFDDLKAELLVSPERLSSN